LYKKSLKIPKGTKLGKESLISDNQQNEQSPLTSTH